MHILGQCLEDSGGTLGITLLIKLVGEREELGWARADAALFSNAAVASGRRRRASGGGPGEEGGGEKRQHRPAQLQNRRRKGAALPPSEVRSIADDDAGAVSTVAADVEC